MVQTETSSRLVWIAVAGATNYDVQVVHEASGTVFTLYRGVLSTFVTLAIDPRAPAQKYLWQVRGCVDVISGGVPSCSAWATGSFER